MCFALLQASQAQKVLTANVGHGGAVTSVAFSPNGKYIASASADYTIKLWNSQSGQEIRTFIGHESAVTSIAFSPDGKYIVSGSTIYFSSDGNLSESTDNIKIWDILSGDEIRIFERHGSVNSVAFSPDGKYIVSGSGSTVILWDSQTGEEIRTFYGNNGRVNSVAFSPDGKYIVSGGEHDKFRKYQPLKLWNSQTGEEIKTLKGHTDDVKSVAFSPNRKYIASGSSDHNIILWDGQSGKKIKILKGHTSTVTSVAFSPNSKYIVSGGGYSNILKLWDSQSGEEIRTFKGHTNRVTSVSFSPDGKYIVSGSNDKTIKLWDSQSGEQVRTFKGYTSSVNSVVFSPNGKEIISGNSDKSVKLWKSQGGNEIKTFKGHSWPVNDIAFSPDNKFIVSTAAYFHFPMGEAESFFKLWDSQNGEEIRTVVGVRQSAGYSIAFSPDGKMVGLGCLDKTIKLWETQSGKLIRTLNGHGNDVISIAYSFDGKYIVSGSYDQTIKLWNSQNGEEIRTFTGHKRPVNSVIFSPDGRYIVSASSDKTLKLWNTQSGQEIRTFTGHKHSVNSVAFSPDGKYIVSSSDDETLKLWNSQSGVEIRTFRGHTKSVNSLAISPKDKYIVSGSDDNTLKLWNYENGKLLLTLIGINNSEDFIAFTPNGKFDGTEKGMELLYYVEGLDIIPLSSLFEQYYTPNLFARVMSGEEFEEPEIKIEDIKLPPLVEIISPENNSKANQKELSITVKATDQGGGIDEIRLYLNGKLVETTQRGFIKVEQKGDTQTKTFTILLSNGETNIKATAFSKQRTESITDEITVFYEGLKKTTNLHMLVIGINQYKNPKYNLNYALTDATAFAEQISANASSIFGNVNITFIKDAEVTKTRILEEFNKLKSTVSLEDVFVFYYAGHGVMSTDDKPKFYLIPHDVTRLYGDNEALRTKAISSEELYHFSKDLQAQKQLFVFDACQSGGMTEMLASRGAAEEKAIHQLARSTGTYWLMASGSEQFATEFATLGHGLFTYTILTGLKGEADGGSKDGKVTVKELSAYLNDKVPLLSEKYKGSPQYPTSFTFGQDFPIIIVE